jgi:hypothetical protein
LASRIAGVPMAPAASTKWRARTRTRRSTAARRRFDAEALAGHEAIALGDERECDACALH